MRETVVRVRGFLGWNEMGWERWSQQQAMIVSGARDLGSCEAKETMAMVMLVLPAQNNLQFPPREKQKAARKHTRGR